MKLKYYLRGLGIGMVVTAVIMGVSLHGKTEPMTDAQVVQRAKELGMEEKYQSEVLVAEDAKAEETKADTKEEVKKEANPETETTSSNTVAQEKTTTDNQATSDDKTISDDKKAEEVKAEDKKTSDDKKTEEVKAEDKKTSDDKKSEEVKTEETTEQVPAGDSIEITVNGGEGSLTVAKKLVSAGLISDAKTFDTFLCSKGYDRKICTGKHTFVKGAKDEDIAKELMTKGK